jgi:N-methylhydantoinase B
VAALRVGARRLEELARRPARAASPADMRALQRYSARAHAAALAEAPAGRYRARDVLDDDGFGRTDLRIAVAITSLAGGRAVDFAGSAPQTAGP